MTPNTSLLMWKVDSKTYQYDNVSPVCERASVNSPIISFGGAFVSDAELALSASGFNA